MSHELQPLILEPHPSRRLWGGSRLGPLLGIETPEGDDPVGEAWLVYAKNRVAAGAWQGRTLQEVADALGAALVGTAPAARYGSRVPLLVKLIDAAAPLSIQVHPDDVFARRQEADTGHLGKEEAWYVLEAEPGASIVWGFAQDVDAARVRRAVDEESLEALVQTVPVEAGDVIYNPAGRVHAIGAGIFLFEVQQSSDLTYRLYDYGRRDARGRLRELHLDKALAVADLSAGGRPKVPANRANGWQELVRSEFFVMERRLVDGTLDDATEPTSLETLVWARGSGRVQAMRDAPARTEAHDARTRAGAHDDQAVVFAHEAVVLPAGLGPYRVEGRGELLRCRVPATFPQD